MVNKSLIFVVLALMLVLPMVSAGSGYKLYPDKTTYDGVEIGTPDFWIDNYHTDDNGNKVYHIDALRDLYINETNESNNEKVRLYLPYLVQPDYIKHINHVGEHVRTYFPTNEDWEWEYECNPETEDCEGVEGYVILRVDKIDKGLGSNTFPIGIDGPQWASQGQDYGVFDGDGSYISIPQNINSSVSSNITFCFWEYTNNNNAGYFMGDGDNFTNLYFRRNVGSESVIFNLGDSAMDAYTLSNEIYHHHCISHNSSGYYELIVDGNYIQNQTGSVFLGFTDDLYIGNRKDSERDFNGSIDEVLIYNRSLSQAEITALYNNYSVTSTGINRTGTPSTDGLVLNINFDNHSVADLSGEENHGTNTNVSFGTVYDDLVTLVKGVDYSINTNIFTIIDTSYSWSKIFVSYNYLIGGNAVANMSRGLTDGVDNVSIKIPQILSIVGVLLLFGVLVLLIKGLDNNGVNDFGVGGNSGTL